MQSADHTGLQSLEGAHCLPRIHERQYFVPSACCAPQGGVADIHTSYDRSCTYLCSRSVLVQALLISKLFVLTPDAAKGHQKLLRKLAPGEARRRDFDLDREVKRQLAHVIMAL